MPMRYRSGPLERVPRLSQELPAQAIGPWTMCATSAIGSRAICAPSKAQPPSVAPGLGLAQPDFSFLLCSQEGSSSSSAMSLAFIAYPSGCVGAAFARDVARAVPERRQLI
ncbi:hypothetical protein D9M71_634750 [compost metagenome]